MKALIFKVTGWCLIFFNFFYCSFALLFFSFSILLSCLLYTQVFGILFDHGYSVMIRCFSLFVPPIRLSVV